MKICYVARCDLFSKRGGDTILCELYMKIAKDVGYDVVTWTSSTTYVEADFYHAFNIDRPLEIFPRLRIMATRGKKFIITTLHHPHMWVERFRKNALGLSIKSKLFYKSYLGNNICRAETIKEVVRQTVNKTFEPTTIMYSWMNRIKWILENADVILLQSRLEASYIMTDYGLSIPEKTLVTLPNPAMNKSTKIYTSKNGKAWDALFVGRVEIRKNPFSLALAASRTNKRVLFIGAPNPNESDYVARFTRLVEKTPTFQWIKGVSREDLQKHYMHTKMLINPSYVEVSPIVDIEALAHKCPLITTKYALHHEFLPSGVTTCDPYSIESILENLNMVHQYLGPARIPSESEIAESLAAVYLKVSLR